ncbi:hypothetical protein [Pseudomonas syringae]|uniref:hypothetical protein n=1 Tax=Pseudomonas syringae TaxID=317 RepID=UPI00245B2937|nr:hypothetical protein [Pseudomonas syringae]MDH4602401.1 hypothetical protein [Pseudomonas syringae pv. papulans]
MGTGITQQDEEKYMAIMAGHEADIARELDELHAANQIVLDQVQAMVSPEAFKQITDTLCDSSYTHGYLIADQPMGEPQDDGFLLGDVYVDQTTNGGITGDEYAGTMSMPLTAGRYFQFCYAC